MHTRLWTGQEITLPLAQEVMKNILGHDEKAITIEIISEISLLTITT